MLIIIIIKCVNYVIINEQFLVVTVDSNDDVRFYVARWPVYWLQGSFADLSLISMNQSVSEYLACYLVCFSKPWWLLCSAHIASQQSKRPRF